MSYSCFSKAPFTAKLGLVVIIGVFCTALFAPLIAPYGQAEVVGDEFMPWSASNILGTDSIGRDILSRLIFGARNSVGMAVITTILAFIIGSVLGIFAAVLRPFYDQLISRVVEVFMAIPSLIFQLLLLAAFGVSFLNIVLIIAFVDSTRVFRLVRAVSIDIVQLDFIEAARLRGEGLFYLVFKEVLPNAAGPMIVEFGVRFCYVFLSIAALSFLGVGIQPPYADWGSMVRENAALIGYGDITPLIPAGAIALLTVAVNFVVDWRLRIMSAARD
ncbi:ABC transporter permease [Mesorhizobium opportunistum]|uniref:ABC transporter permease n=1 Tax=Mesorhizobium opportunistum TaxID=593909 RepID=UPI0033357882